MAFLSTTLLREYSKRNGPTVAMRAHIDTVFNCEDIGMSFVSALAHPDGAPVQVLGAGWVNIIHSYATLSFACVLFAFETLTMNGEWRVSFQQQEGS